MFGSDHMDWEDDLSVDLQARIMAVENQVTASLQLGMDFEWCAELVIKLSHGLYDDDPDLNAQEALDFVWIRYTGD